IHDDFFHRGGHSLKATQVLSRVRQQLGEEISLPAFFQAPTIAQLGAAIDHRPGGGAGGQGAIQPLAGDRTRLPASSSQRRLWFIDQLGQDREVYNLVYRFRMEGPIDPERLRQAIAALVARHESLRTTFADNEGQPVQVIAPPAPVEVPFIDLTSRPEAERNAELWRLNDMDGRQLFDLAKGPLWTAKLVRLAPEDHS